MTSRNTALSICLVCDFFWSFGILGACTYLVFWKDCSGWWYLLAIYILPMWNCKPYRSLEDQTPANNGEDDGLTLSPRRNR